MKIVWSPLALDRVAEIADRTGEERPQVGEAWVERLFGAVDRLAQFPRSGPVVAEVKRENIREVIEGEFRIIYRVESTRVSVLTVRHSRQLTRFEDLSS